MKTCASEEVWEHVHEEETKRREIKQEERKQVSGLRSLKSKVLKGRRKLCVHKGKKEKNGGRNGLMDRQGRDSGRKEKKTKMIFVAKN